MFLSTLRAATAGIITLSGLATAAGAADAVTRTGKAHVLFIPNEAQTSLAIADRSKSAGLNISTTTNGANLSTQLSGKTEKGRQFPAQGYNLTGLTYFDSIPEVGLDMYVPPSCLNNQDNCADDRIVGVSTKAKDKNFAYSGYGVSGVGQQVTPNQRSNWYGAGFTGNLTPLATMNALKSNKVRASYTGSFMGITISNDEYATGPDGKPLRETAGALTKGDVNLQADFKSGNVTGKVSNLVIGIDEPGSEPTTLDQGLSLKAKISGNEYSGTVGITPGTGANKGGGSVSSSALNGGFFGPNAVETAGALRVEGKITPTSGGVAMRDNGLPVKNKAFGIVGSFGATKN